VRTLALVASLAAAPALAQRLPVVQLTAGIHVIRAEVASDSATRAQGLMHRTELSHNAGMLFIFDEHGKHCMWMRNTMIALSVAYLDDRGAIVNIEDMEPQTDAAHCAARPVKYALEMNRGWFAARGIEPGARLGGVPPAK
jgi:uncharacterized membrane protein (UPF0127 family)